MARQLELGAEVTTPKTWGGARNGAGRKPAPSRTTGIVAHRVRDEHVGRWPIHITLRARPDIPSLRQMAVLRALHDCIRSASARGRRFVHFSLQTNHLHVIMEANGRDAIASAVRGFASGTARAFNRVLGRKGPLWEGRYHRHDLKTPTEVHHAIAYVLHNGRKHGSASALDGFSSAAWFEGWDEEGAREARTLEAKLAERGLNRCTAAPKTFLLARGYRRLGEIRLAFMTR